MRTWNPFLRLHKDHHDVPRCSNSSVASPHHEHPLEVLGDRELGALQHGRPPPLPKLTAHGLAFPQGKGDDDCAFALLPSNILWITHREVYSMTAMQSHSYFRKKKIHKSSFSSRRMIYQKIRLWVRCSLEEAPEAGQACNLVTLSFDRVTVQKMNGVKMEKQCSKQEIQSEKTKAWSSI